METRETRVVENTRQALVSSPNETIIVWFVCKWEQIRPVRRNNFWTERNVAGIYFLLSKYSRHELKTYVIFCSKAFVSLIARSFYLWNTGLETLSSFRPPPPPAKPTKNFGASSVLPSVSFVKRPLYLSWVFFSGYNFCLFFRLFSVLQFTVSSNTKCRQFCLYFSATCTFI